MRRPAAARPVALLFAVLLPWALRAAEVVEHAAYPNAALGRAMAYTLVLPDGWRGTAERFPILYLLHGVGDDDTAWLRRGAVRETVERLAAAGRIGRLVVAMPDAARSWYVDAPAGNSYARAIDDDFVAMMEAHYPVRPGRGSRAVAGMSMGGQGALRFAFARPDRYAAVAALSPALWSRVQPGTVPDERHERVFRGAFGAPFDPARFIAASPAAMVGRVAAAPVRPAILLLAARDDLPAIVADTAALAAALASAGVPHGFEIADGRHDWGYWTRQLERVLLFVDQAFAAAAPAGLSQR